MASLLALFITITKFSDFEWPEAVLARGTHELIVPTFAIPYI